MKSNLRDSDNSNRTTREKTGKYHKIYEQILENPLISNYDIAAITGLSRNTVSKYLGEMYANSIMTGPFLQMKSASNYKEYVYLMNFSDPSRAFDRLKEFPHTVYTAFTFGDWNTMVITNQLLNFSELANFESMVHQSVKYCSYTPRTEYLTWYESFERVYEKLYQFTPGWTEYKNRELTSLDWGENEWKLFCAFNFMRKKATPVLRSIEMYYEVYAKWMKTLEDHCTIHTGFYPQGYQNYVVLCFLFYTDYEESVKYVFSQFPTTSLIMELEKSLLVFVHVMSSDVRLGLMCLIYDMEKKKMIKGFRQALILSHTWNKV